MERFDAGEFLRLAARHRVSHAMLVPVQYRRILDHPGFEATDLSSFRAKLSTSAPFPAREVDRAGSHGQHLRHDRGRRRLLMERFDAGEFLRLAARHRASHAG